MSHYTDYLLTGFFSHPLYDRLESNFRKNFFCGYDGDKGEFIIFKNIFISNYESDGDGVDYYYYNKVVDSKEDDHSFDFYMDTADKISRGKAVWPEFHLKLTTSEIFNKEILELFQRGKPIQRKEYEKNKKITERRRLSPNEIGIAQPDNLGLSEKARQEFSLQQMRQLLGLSSRRQLQVQGTLGYFKQQPHLLAEKAYRDIFNILMFDSTLLLEEMKTPSSVDSFVSQLAAFCQRGLEDNLQPDAPSLDTALFYLQINRRLADYVAGVQGEMAPSFPAHFKAGFFDTRQDIKKLQARADLPRIIQHALHRELVAYYTSRKSLTAEETADFLISSIQLSLFDPGEMQKDTFVEIETRDALRERNDELHAAIFKTDGDILDQVLRAFYPEAARQAWDTAKFPLCSTADGSYTIDARRGRIYANHAQLSILPACITTHKTFTDLFQQETTFAAHQIQKDTFEFSDKRGNHYRVSISDKGQDSNELIIRRQFHDKLYKKFSSSVLPFIFQNADVWVAATPNEEAWITQQTTHAPLYHIEPVKQGAAAGTSVIHQLDEKGEKTGLVVMDISCRDAPFSFLRRFEDPSHIIILQEAATGMARSIELSRYGITFNVEKISAKGYGMGREKAQWRAVSALLDDFQLAGTQGVASLAKFEDYLVLEKPTATGDVQRRVIISDSSFGGVERGLVPEAVRQSGSRSQKKQLFAYDVNVQSGLLEPRSEAARLMLARNYLWVHDYDQAKKYLYGFGSQLQPLSMQEKAILFDIAKLNENNKDPHPKAAALRLKALVLLFADHEDHYKPSSIDSQDQEPLEEILNAVFNRKTEEKTPNALGEKVFKMLYEGYPNYLENLEYLGDFKLSVQEEVLLLKLLDTEMIKKKQNNVQAVLANRIRTLAKESYDRLQPLPANMLQWVQTYFERLPFYQYGRPSTLNCEKDKWIGNLINSLKRDESRRQAASILKPTLLQDFPYYYRALSHPSELTRDHLIKLVSKMAGTDYATTDLTADALWQVVRKTLAIKLAGEDEYESMTALVLRSLLNYVLQWRPTFPQSLGIDFPPAEEVINACNTLSSSSDNYTANESATGVIGSVFEIAQRFNMDIQSALPQGSMMDVEAPSATARTPQQIEGMCLNLLDHPFGSKAVVANLQEYLIKKDAPSQNLLPNTPPGKAELLDVFSVSAGDAATKRELQRIKALVAGAKLSKEEAPSIYAVKDFARLHSLKLDLQQTLAQGRTALAEKHLKIEALANQPFPDRALQAAREVRIVAVVERPIDIDEALRLFLHADTAFYRQRNPALTDQDVVALVNTVQAYLAAATYQQHLARFVAAIEQLERFRDAKAPAEDLQQAVQEVAAIATSYRAYSVAKHPQYLVFEYYMNVLLRKDQAANLAKLKLNDGKVGAPQHLGAVLEMIMGAGKTSVILPLLSLLNADGEQLAIALLPDALMTSMAPELQKTLGQSFEQVLEVFEFDRDSRLDNAKLQRIYERLERIRGERKLLLMKNSSLQSLYLKFAEKLDIYTSNVLSGKAEQASVMQEIRLFQKIFGLLKASGNVMIDEVDTVLDVLKSFHYTVGASKSLDPVYSNALTDLYLFLATDANVNQSVRLGFTDFACAIPFSKEHYDATVKPMLTRALLEGRIGAQNKPLQAFLAKLSGKERLQLEDFLMNRPGQAGGGLIERQAAPYVQDLLALYKEEFNELLPLTAQKNLNEHYGKNPDKLSDHLAVPYHHSKPNPTSQFGTEVEVLNYSIQMHLASGLPQDIIEKEIARLQLLLLSERKKFATKPIKALDSYQKFLQLTGGVTRYNINKLSADDLKAITKIVNTNRQLQIELIKNYVVPEIKVYATQLNADAQMFGLLFKHTQGMSGTLWNVDTFPKQMQLAYPSDTTAKTLNLLWQNSPPHVETIDMPSAGGAKNRQGIKDLLAKIYSRQGLPNGSFIDTAGMFRDVANRADVAEAMLRLDCWQGTDIKGVAFYDGQNKLMVMTLVDGRPHSVELARSSLTKEEIVAFWDQEHTTGSDIKLGARMTAVVSVGRHTLLRDLLQAVWRLRGLDKAQRVNFLVTAEDREIIKTTLKQSMAISVNGELELKHLILYVINNQAERQGNDNYRSFKQKMQAHLLEKVLAVALDPNLPETDLSQLFDGCRELFSSIMTARPFELYGKTASTDAREKVVAADVADFLNSKAMQTFRSLSLLKGKFDSQAIEREIRALAEAELKLLPDRLVQSARYGRQRTVQVEKESETQKEVETKKERAVYPANPGKFRPPTNWELKDLFTNSYFTPKSFDSDLSLFIDSSTRKFFSGIGTPLWLMNHFSGILGDARPVFSVQDAFKNTPELARGGSRFDSRLLFSLNLWPETERLVDSTPFGFAQKEADYALAIEDKQTGGLRLMLLDNDDAAAFKTMLQDDSLNPDKGQKRELRLTLYHFDSGTLVQGKEGIAAERFEKDGKLLTLKVQAKFFRGDSNYSRQELVQLEKWLKGADTKALYELFMQKILLWKDESRAHYFDSPLHQLFIKLGAAESLV